MKTLWQLALTTGLLISTIPAVAAEDKLNLAGSYKCTGYDSYDGAFNGVLTLTKDEAASDPKHNSGAYQVSLKLKVPNVSDTYNYKGYAASQGERLAIFFANEQDSDPVGKTDRGVGVAHVSHDQDVDGKYTTTIRKFYYLPEYKRDAKDGTTKAFGGHGRETCVKVE